MSSARVPSTYLLVIQRRCSRSHRFATYEHGLNVDAPYYSDPYTLHEQPALNNGYRAASRNTKDVSSLDIMKTKARAELYDLTAQCW